MSPSHVMLRSGEIVRAARAVTTALAHNNLHSCLFGSAACWIYGMSHRIPNDVDVVVLTEIQQEELKQIIVETDDNFYLVQSRNPHATYQVLWYSLPSRRGSQRRACKVDVLIPGLLSIPNVPSQKLQYDSRFDDIPLMPLSVVILLKLRGWADHRGDERQYMIDKIPQDEDDIDELLAIAVDEHGCSLRQEKWLPRWFIQEAIERVQEFVQEWPDSTDYWRAMGVLI